MAIGGRKNHPALRGISAGRGQMCVLIVILNAILARGEVKNLKECNEKDFSFHLE